MRNINILSIQKSPKESKLSIAACFVVVVVDVGVFVVFVVVVLLIFLKFGNQSQTRI